MVETIASPGEAPALPYPGRPVLAGDSRLPLVRQIQVRLNDSGCGPVAEDGRFGPVTRQAVVRFQVREGLLPDGAIGPATWARLFPEPAPPAPFDRFAARLVRIAGAEVGVRESGGPNRGPRVDEYLRNVGLDPARGSFAWCASFVYFCFTRAAADLGMPNPCVKTAGCMDHWHRAPDWARIPADAARRGSPPLRPGTIFIVDHGQGRGHTGLIEGFGPGSIKTIEGNTNAGGGREGDGVYRRVRPLAEIRPGFIDYGLRPAGPLANG